MDKIVRLPEVMARTGLARSTIYKKIIDRDFPKQIPLGVKSVGWLESDIEKWIEQRIAQSKSTTINQ